jgi:hypothetical protein
LKAAPTQEALTRHLPSSLPPHGTKAAQSLADGTTTESSSADWPALDESDDDFVSQAPGAMLMSNKSRVAVVSITLSSKLAIYRGAEA